MSAKIHSPVISVCLQISLNVGFMFGRLNNGWSHMIVYGFAYPMLMLTMIAPLCAVMLGMGKREKREGDRRFVSFTGAHLQNSVDFMLVRNWLIASAQSSLSNDLVAFVLWLGECACSATVHRLVLYHWRRDEVGSMPFPHWSHYSFQQLKFFIEKFLFLY